MEEKGSLFQKQFQLFQAEFVQKEDNLLDKLNKLQEELDIEKAKNTKNNTDSSEVNLLKSQINELNTKSEKDDKIKLELETRLNETKSKSAIDLNELNAKLNDLLNENHTVELKELNKELNELKEQNLSLDAKLKEEIEEKSRLAELLKAKETKAGNDKKMNKLKI